MRVLVTGGAGYIGSFAVRRLLSEGHEVVVLDNLTTGFRDAVPGTVTLIEHDLRNVKGLPEIIENSRVESILHFAALTVVPDSVRDPVGYSKNNFGGSLNLLEAALKVGVKNFIFSSTAAVYASQTDGFVSENSPVGPLNPYGESKLHTEQLLHRLHESSDLSYIALRYFNVAGACLENKLGQRTKNATHLIKVAAEVASGKRSHIDIFGTDYPTQDGSAVRDYIHVEDLISAHIQALVRVASGKVAETYNCGYSRGSSVFEVVAAMEEVSGKKIEKRLASRRPGDAAQVVADSTKIRRVLEWKPEHDDLRTICKTAYFWEKSLR